MFRRRPPYTIFCVWGVFIMPITSDYWMLLLSNHFLISSVLTGRTHKNCYYVYFKAFVMSLWREGGGDLCIMKTEPVCVSCHTCCQHQCSNQNESLNFCWHFQLATKTPTVCSKRMLGSAAKPLRVLTLYPSAYSRTITKHQSSTSLSNKLLCRIKHGWLFFIPPQKGREPLVECHLK